MLGKIRRRGTTNSGANQVTAETVRVTGVIPCVSCGKRFKRIDYVGADNESYSVFANYDVNYHAGERVSLTVLRKYCASYKDVSGMQEIYSN